MHHYCKVTTYHRLLHGRQLPGTELNSFQAQDNCNNITITLTIYTVSQKTSKIISTIDWSRDARLHTSDTVAAEFARSKPGRLQHLECSAGESLPLQNCWRRWTQNTSDRWVGAVWPVDRWCRYQPVASPSKRLCPCTWGTLRAQILTILKRTVNCIILLNKP